MHAAIAYAAGAAFGPVISKCAVLRNIYNSREISRRIIITVDWACWEKTRAERASCAAES